MRRSVENGEILSLLGDLEFLVNLHLIYTFVTAILSALLVMIMHGKSFLLCSRTLSIICLTMFCVTIWQIKLKNEDLFEIC